jgi:hypothetical protein
LLYGSPPRVRLLYRRLNCKQRLRNGLHANKNAETQNRSWTQIKYHEKSKASKYHEKSKVLQELLQAHQRSADALPHVRERMWDVRTPTFSARETLFCTKPRDSHRLHIAEDRVFKYRVMRGGSLTITL